MLCVVVVVVVVTIVVATFCSLFLLIPSLFLFVYSTARCKRERTLPLSRFVCGFWNRSTLQSFYTFSDLL
jgi:hypothetical protein